MKSLLASRTPEPDLFVVAWHGELLEGEWPDAIAFSRAAAQALIERSPGRAESYSIESWSFRRLINAPAYAEFEGALRDKIRRRDASPLMLRDEAERAKRAR